MSWLHLRWHALKLWACKTLFVLRITDGHTSWCPANRVID